MSEKIFRLLIALVIGVWVTRYLGPEDFGILSYSRSFVAIFTAFSSLGLKDILVRELVKSKDSSNVLLGTSFGLQTLGSLLIMIFLTIAILINDNEPITNKIIIILGLVTFLHSFNIISSYFISLVKSKYAAIPGLIGIVISSILKIVLILTDSTLISFVYLIVFDVVFLSVGQLFFYHRLNQSILNWKFSSKIAKRLLRDAWPLILSGLIISIYMKVDQIMIKEILNNSAVGQYAAAVRLSEAWYFIPSIICTSLFPAIINAKLHSEKLYVSRLQRLFDLMVILGLAVVVPVTLLSDWGVHLLYGDEFSSTAAVLNIHIWAGIFVFLGVANQKWFISENLQIYTILCLGLGMVSNVVLNLVLIPKYGILGAAYATLISQFISSVLSPALFKKTRPSFYRMLNSLLLINILKEIKSLR